MRKQAGMTSRPARREDDRPLRHGDTSWSLMSKFFFLWTAGPICVRLLTVWLNTPPQATAAAFISTVVARAATVIPQDLLVTAQAFLFCFLLKGLLANKWFGWPGCLAASLIATILFALVQIYILFDFLVFYKAGGRMDVSFFASLSHNGAFGTLLADHCVVPLLMGLGAIAVLAMFTFQFFYDAFPDLTLSYRNLFWLLLSIVSGLSSTWFVPTEIGYAANNLVVQDEAHWLLAIIRGKPDLTVTTDENSLLHPLRQAEQSQPVGKDYPLLKNTLAFTGEKQFELRVDPKERPHVVFLQLESFRAANVGVLGGKLPASPNFDRLAHEGILFTEFYGNSIRAPRADVASLFGILPNFVPREVQAANSGLPLIGLPDLLHRSGYQSGYFNGSSLEFDNLGNFARRHGFDVVQGDEDMRRAYPQATRSSWGIHDEYLMHYLVSWLETQDRAGRPAFAFARTTSNRQPWQTPPAFKTPRFDVPADGEYSRFLGTFSYTDACLGAFVKMLRERGLDKKTIVFVYGDHGMPMGEHFENCSATNYLFEENLRVPLLILAPGRIETPMVVEQVASQVDLLPTVMDLLGITGENHALGTSLVRRVPDRPVFFNNPFAMQYVGMRQGEWKYVFTVRTHASSLFNLVDDPEETKNVAEANPELVKQFHSRAVGLNQWVTQNYCRESFAPHETPEKKPTDKAAVRVTASN